jgi:hypothetical protein
MTRERNNTFPFLALGEGRSAFRLGCCLLTFMLAADTTNLMRWSPRALYALLRANPVAEEIETEDGGRSLVSHAGNLRQPRRKVGSAHPPGGPALPGAPRFCSRLLSHDPSPPPCLRAVPAGLSVPLRC